MTAKDDLAQYIFCFCIIFIIFTTGCSLKKSTMNGYENIPEEVRLDVPLIQQKDNFSCATTALAMVMSYYDKKIYTANEVWSASGSKSTEVRRKGNDIYGLKKAAKKYGFTDYEFRNNLSTDDLRVYIAQGIPVVVNIRNYFSNSSHAVVVTGYDTKNLYINDPNHMSSYRKNYQYFLENWWAHLSYPEGKYKKSAFIIFPRKH